MELRGNTVVLRDFRASDRPLFVEAVGDPEMWTYTKMRMDPEAVNRAMTYLLREPTIQQPRRTFNLVVQTDEVEFAAARGGRPDCRHLARSPTALCLRHLVRDMTVLPSPRRQRMNRGWRCCTAVDQEGNTTQGDIGHRSGGRRN